jgi:NADH:ubiquinone oxidoreductase subunit H
MTTVALRVLLSLVAVLIAIAFYTLWERKAMGASHRRFGPVLVG